MAAKKIPEGYRTVTPYLLVHGVEELCRFAERAFGAKEATIVRDADGRAMHAEITIGDSRVMIGEATRSPPTTAALHLYVDDADAVYRRALQAGGTSVMEPADQFWGDRMGAVRDAFGNVWFVSTHVEDVSEEEMQRRMQALHAQGEHANP